MLILNPKNTAAIFPGQGSQTLNMGKELYESEPKVRLLFGEVNDALGYDITKIIFGNDALALQDTEKAQPAIMATSVAIAQVLQDRIGAIADWASYVAGHSLGEYTALCLAGSINLYDTAKLLSARGKAMAKASKNGGMAAVIGATMEQMDQLISLAKGEDILVKANDNAVGQVIISGNNSALDRAIELCGSVGIKKIIKLAVSGAFHSPMMEAAAEELSVALAKTEIKTPKIKFICNVLAEEVQDPEQIRGLLLQQLTSAVRWRETILKLKNLGCESALEIGPGAALSGMIVRTASEIKTLAVNNLSTINSVDINNR